jgi:phosphonate ABC transporter permease subunit PhnE
MDTTQRAQALSFAHGFLSALVPGLGQALGGQARRGVYWLATFVTLGWLTIWTIARRARFPDMTVSAGIFVRVFVFVSALLVFIIALRYLLSRFLFRDDASASAAILTAILYLLALIYGQGSILAMAGTEEQLALVFGGTAVFAGGALAAFYFWQIGDAARIKFHPLPQTTGGIVLACLVIFSLGWSLTEVDMEKMIREYRDANRVMPRLLWPWRSAFEYEVIAVEVGARVQAPCPPGAGGPEVVQPAEDEAWVSVTPTCGDLSQRALTTGALTLGTELSITGGNFRPGAVVEIFWKNPIGNPFEPRGVGETEITIAADGTFASTLHIPEVIIPSTAEGDQIHTLLIRQESGEVFTGRLSEEMILALELMLETIMVGVMASFFGLVFSLPFSFLAARNLMAPIRTVFVRIMGGIAGLFGGLWLAGLAAGSLSAGLGGLDEAPLQVAGAGLTLYVVLGGGGWNLGQSIYRRLSPLANRLAGRALSAATLGALGYGFGHALGLGISRGVVAIPVGADVARLTEPLYALVSSAALGTLGLVYGFAAAHREFKLGLFVYGVTRTLMNIIRSVEPLVWAIVMAIWVGLGPFAGTVALTLHTIAALGKLYSEAIESIDPGPLEALNATGASRLQTVMYAVVPQIVPPFISFTIYRWDINVRMSTVIGLVGGGGIGFILIQWIRLFQYDHVGLAVWLITLTVATLDYVSSNIRERFV